MKNIVITAVAVITVGLSTIDADACTGISLKAKDGSQIVARTIEWAATPMNCGYSVVPRNHLHRSFTPSGENGLEFTSKYGYVGIYTEYEPFIVEGVNETGLSAGLFFFPDYGEYVRFDPTRQQKTLCDMQFVSWVLSSFDSIDQVIDSVNHIDIVGLDSRIGTVHWRITQPDGRMVVLEIVEGVPNFYENKLGVLTNAPGFEWHLANLNNYVNLRPGSASDINLTPELSLKPLGHGSGMIGIPGDFTSPSRFIRAAFFQSTAPTSDNGFDCCIQAFHILNNFDIPIGSQHIKSEIPENLPSATQITTSVDLNSLTLYYRTAWNSNIRSICIGNIDFTKIKFISHPLDSAKLQPVEPIKFDL